MAAYYFKYPFAVDGDKTAVSTTGTNSGTMSWEAGFTPNYELNLATDPTALPIPRGQMNQVLNTITTEIQRYQQHGVPDWISAADNGGSAYAYDLYARVRYSATPLVASSYLIYENQVQGNTATPGTDSTWLLISGEANGVPTGTIIDFAGATAPVGYLACDGSAVSRTTYVTLFNTLTQVQTATLTNLSASVTALTSTAQMYVGMAVEGTGVPSGTVIASIVSSTAITLSNAATAGGTGVSLRFFNWCPTFIQSGSLTNASAVVTGLSSTSGMFAGMAVQGWGLPANTTILSVDSGTQVTLSANAVITTVAGTVTTDLTFYSLGNGDGSTTFNVPSLNRRSTLGSGGTANSPVFPGNVLGMAGGEETHTQLDIELPPHSHFTFNSPAGGTSSENNSPGAATGINNAGTSGTGPGNSTPMNVMQYGVIVNKIIKT